MPDEHHHSEVVHASHPEYRPDDHPESFHALTEQHHEALKAAGFKVHHHHSRHHGHHHRDHVSGSGQEA
jgi:hypothetical protein